MVIAYDIYNIEQHVRNACVEQQAAYRSHSRAGSPGLEETLPSGNDHKLDCQKLSRCNICL